VRIAERPDPQGLDVPETFGQGVEGKVPVPVPDAHRGTQNERQGGQEEAQVVEGASWRPRPHLP
jgi:hypothetical protein